VNPIPADILGVRDRRDVAWVDAHCTPQAIATFEERVKLTGNFENIQDIAYMFPTECHPNLLVSHERARAKGWKSRTIDNSSHELMIDNPQMLAEFLLERVPTELNAESTPPTASAAHQRQLRQVAAVRNEKIERKIVNAWGLDREVLSR
jgi:hypothetical protein